MNALALIQEAAREDVPSPVVPYVEQNPGAVLLNPRLRERFFDEIRAEIESTPVDVSTDKGRGIIKSLAYKVARTKKPIDEAGKKLKEEAQKRVQVVDALRRECGRQLDELQEIARKPVTDWEAAEEKRVEYCRSFIQHIRDCGMGFIGGSPQPFGLLLRELEEKVVPEIAGLAEFSADAESARIEAIGKVRAAMQAEADRAELERLRADEEQRQRLAEEAERAARQEAEIKARAEAAAIRAIEEAAAAERRKAAEALAAERRAAEEKARKERAEHEAEVARLAAEKKKLEDADRARKAEEAKKAAAEAAARAEDARRQKDRAHRAAVIKRVKDGLMREGSISEEQAADIVRAIIAGSIERLSIQF